MKSIKIVLSSVLAFVVLVLGFQLVTRITSAAPSTNPPSGGVIQADPTAPQGSLVISNVSNVGKITTGIWNGSPIPVANGGTGATQWNGPGGALDNLNAAKVGANSDITSITGLTTMLAVNQGGTGAATLTGLLLGNGTSAFTTVANNSANWDTAYANRLRWDGGSTSLVAATGRTSLGLGSLATLSAIGSTEITDGTVASVDVAFNYAGSSTKGGAATTATALAANGANCSAGSYPVGVDASGAAEGCTVAGTGTVTSVTGTAPIVSSGGSTPAISIAQANTSTNGYLSSTDWTTFNSKSATGSCAAGQYVSGITSSAAPTCSTPPTSATTTSITDDTSTSATMYPTWVTTASGSQAQKVSSTKLTFNPSTGVLTSTGFSGPLTGNVSGNLTGNVTGNVSGSSGSTTGNAATATQLQTARSINGVSFNGTADITVTAAAGTLTGATLNSGVTASSLTSVGSLTSLLTSGAVGIGTAVSTYKLDVVSGGATTARFGTATTDTVVVGGGTGKITAGTFDPVYTIGGKKYATYSAGIIGVKEEVTGIATLDKNKVAVLDLSKSVDGSDLWLFSKATNLNRDNFNNVVVLLSPSFDGRVWYKKDADNLKITIYGGEPGEISYRLTAPRFDSNNWSNISHDSTEGFNLDKLIK